MDRLRDASLAWFALTGALGMLVNFPNLVLYVPALHAIDASNVSEADKCTALVLLWLITLTPVLVPLAAVLALGRRADPLLIRSNVFVAAHTTQVTVAIESVFSAYLLFKGVTGLT
jgi:hypothetical protein